jgi:hypothetical protein
MVATRAAVARDVPSPQSQTNQDMLVVAEDAIGGRCTIPNAMVNYPTHQHVDNKQVRYIQNTNTASRKLLVA